MYKWANEVAGDTIAPAPRDFNYNPNGGVGAATGGNAWGTVETF